MGGGLVAFPVRVPHFDLPFRFIGGSASVVEQDSEEDIANCVETIIRTPYGYRVQDYTPDFGILQPTFEIQPVDTELIKSTILVQEPRADILITEHSDRLDRMIDNITAEIL